MKRFVALVVLLVVVCAGGVAAERQGAAAAGEKVFTAQKCTICHSLQGKGNKNGPLDGVGSKLSAAEMREWLTSPVEMAKKQNATRKPPMKSFAALPKEDIDALVAYLQTLKK